MEELNPDNIDWKVAEYHVMGDSNAAIAEKLGINRSTVWRRLQTPECQAAVNAIRNIFYNSLAPHIIQKQLRHQILHEVNLKKVRLQ